MSDRETNRIQMFDSRGRLLRIWVHPGCARSLYLTAKDEMRALTHRNNSQDITCDTLAGG